MEEKNKQIRKRANGFIVMLALGFFWIGSANLSVRDCHASKVEVQVKANRVSVVARQAPLIDVFNELSRQARFNLIAGAPLDQVVTLNINTATIEDCIRQLVANQSHAMYYKKLPDGSIALTEVQIFGAQMPTQNSPSTPVQHKENEQLRFDPEGYVKAFSDRTALSKQLKTKRMDFPANEHPPGKGGIQVTEVALDSLFSRIGIAKGDILTSVNGTEITSGQAFLDSMRWTPAAPSAIRIERFKQGGQLDPIYIYVESN